LYACSSVKYSHTKKNLYNYLHAAFEKYGAWFLLVFSHKTVQHKSVHILTIYNNSFGNTCELQIH
jgi:hypothetical protein